MKKLVIYFIILLAFISLVNAQYYYTNTGSLFGNFNFLDFYSEYAYEVDFFIFLIIFLGITKSVFKSKFKEGSGLLIAGVSIALALAMVLWEYNTGKSLLSYGSIGITILILLAVFVIGYAFLKFVIKAIFPGK